MDDVELLASFVRDKSQEAFQTLVRRHVGMVYSVCRRQLNDAHWAEDVTQAVFILLARKAEGLPGDVVLGGWLYKTAVFACSNARSLKRTRTYHESRVTPMKIRDDQEDAERAEMEGLLDAGLMELSKAQREVLVLRFFEKKPVAEVARMRNESLYMTQKTLETGLRKLRRFLAQRGVAATAGIVLALLAEESAKAVPAGLAASVGSAALESSGSGMGATSYASELAGQLLKQAGRAKLLATVTAVSVALALGLTVYGMRVKEPAAGGVPAVVAGNFSEAEEIDALWKTLSRAELALRQMDTAGLPEVVAFNNPQQAENWDVMSRVFAADQKMKESAAAKFGVEGSTLTAIQTFGQRLDEVLPAIDRKSLAWAVHPYDATLHFDYKDKKTAGGSLMFVKVAGQWKIDAWRSMDVALEGLSSNMLRVAVQELGESERSGVINRMQQMEQMLDAVRRKIETEPGYGVAAAKADLQKIDSSGGSRAFFHLALRLDRQEQPRE